MSNIYPEFQFEIGEHVRCAEDNYTAEWVVKECHSFWTRRPENWWEHGARDNYYVLQRADGHSFRNACGASKIERV